MKTFKQYYDEAKASGIDVTGSAPYRYSRHEYSVHDREMQWTWLQIQKLIQDASMAIGNGKDYRSVLVHLQELIYKEFKSLEGYIGQDDADE